MKTPHTCTAASKYNDAQHLSFYKVVMQIEDRKYQVQPSCLTVWKSTSLCAHSTPASGCRLGFWFRLGLNDRIVRHSTEIYRSRLQKMHFYTILNDEKPVHMHRHISNPCCPAELCLSRARIASWLDRWSDIIHVSLAVPNQGLAAFWCCHRSKSHESIRLLKFDDVSHDDLVKCSLEEVRLCESP